MTHSHPRDHWPLRPPAHGQDYPPMGEPDPLTDSAVRRGVGIGTTVRFHLRYGGPPVDVTLVDIRDVTTWTDLVGFVLNRWDIVVGEPGHRIITGDAYYHVEELIQ